MNILPNTASTILNLPLQGDLLDISGNGLHGTSVNASTNAPVAATFATIATGIIALDCNTSGKKAIFPATSLLRFAGACTFQWLMLQPQTYTMGYFTCADPALARVTPEGIGSLYTLWATRGLPHIADQFLYNDGHSGGPATELLPDNPNGSYAVADWTGGAGALAQIRSYAITRNASGVWQAYVDGDPIGVTVASIGTNVVSGLERCWLGGGEVFGSGAFFAGVRVSTGALPPAQIREDASYVLGPTPVHDPMPTYLSKVGATGNLYRHRPKAFGDQWRNPGDQ